MEKRILPLYSREADRHRTAIKYKRASATNSRKLEKRETVSVDRARKCPERVRVVGGQRIPE